MTSLGGTSLGSVLVNSTPLNSTLLNNTSTPTLKHTPSNKNGTIKKNNVTKKENKKPNESAIALKIRKIQEEKRLAEEAEEKLRIEAEALEQQLLLQENEKRKSLIAKSVIYHEKNKNIQKDQQKQELINKSIAKYGYNPNIKPTLHKDKKITIQPQINEQMDDDAWDESEEPKEIKEEIIEPTLKAPVICVLGHIDAGKTHLLDKIRASAIYATEAGSITQQIGASYVSKEMMKQFTNNNTLDVPGLIVIDTPGHEPFVNLRSRASNLCDIAILLVDLLVGVQGQTISCIHMLVNTDKLFVIALNKVDLLYNYDKNKALLSQSPDVLREFYERTKHIKIQLQELGYNVELYNLIDNDEYYPLVPISAITGEGVGNLLLFLGKLSQKQQQNITINNDVVCTVLEVNHMEGCGMVVNAILTNGTLNKGDQIMLINVHGEIITTRIKGIFVNHYDHKKGNLVKETTVNASTTCIINAPNLDDIVAGSQVYVINNILSPEMIDSYKHKLLHTFNSLSSKVKGVGVLVCASTLGALEAMFDFLLVNNIDIGSFKIGPPTKKDIMKATLHVIAFDVDISKEIKEYAKEHHIMIFEHNIIYTLFELYMDYVNNEKKKEDLILNEQVVFPCIMSILPTCIFNKQSPIILGVHIDKGILRKNTPIHVNSCDIGRVKSIEKNNKAIDEAKVGDDVCIMIEQKENLQQYLYGRHFTHKDLLYSKITRESIDAMKELYPTILEQPTIFKLMKQLKVKFDII